MECIIRHSCDEVDWQQVHAILKRVHMSSGSYELSTLRQAFVASYATAFAWHEEQVIGCARAISDGICNAAIYDVAIAPEFQRMGVGTKILRALLARLGSLNVILFATPGMENFYLSLGMRRMKTGMARFVAADYMSSRGFTEAL